jgi:precorrin-3B methylase
MKIRRNIGREDLELLIKFLEKVLNDEELSMLAGLIVGGILAREFEKAGLKVKKKVRNRRG